MPCQKIPQGQTPSGPGYLTIEECQENCGCGSDCDCGGNLRCLDGQCQSCGQHGPFNVIAAGENPIDTGIDVSDWDVIVVYILGCSPDGTPYPTIRQVTVLIDDFEQETVNCRPQGCDRGGEVLPFIPGRLFLGYPGIENPNLMGTVLDADLQVCVTVVVNGQLN